MGEIKNSTVYIVITILTNFFIVVPITLITTYISKPLTTIIVITFVLITIFEILLIDILINLNNNSIIQTKILEKIKNEQTIENQVDIKQ